MLALLLTLLAPTPPDRPPESPAGVWVVDGAMWAGYTLHFGADGTYAAWNETTYYVGVWSASRGRLAITERAVVWDGGCEHYSPPRREEFEGLKVSGGRLTAGRLTMRRAE